MAKADYTPEAGSKHQGKPYHVAAAQYGGGFSRRHNPPLSAADHEEAESQLDSDSSERSSPFSQSATAMPETHHDEVPTGKDEEKPTHDGKIIHNWNGPDDPENPFNWSKTYKWVFTVTVCLISLLIALPAGSYGPGDDWYEEQFHVQNRPFPNLYWATTSWNMGSALFPLLFVPLTEHSGRMPGYRVSRRCNTDNFG